MKHLLICILIILNPVLCMAQAKEPSNPLDQLTIEVEGHKVKPTILGTGQHFFVPQKGVYLSKLSYMYIYQFVPKAQKKIDDKKEELDTFYMRKIGDLKADHAKTVKHLEHLNTDLIRQLATCQTKDQISEEEYSSRVSKYRWALAISGVIILSSSTVLLLK